MTKFWLSAPGLFAGTLFTVIAVSETEAAAGGLATQVRGVFESRCAGCHGPALAKPKGRFGYVLDLYRLAENPELVIPSEPSHSELWLLVEHDEMPPTDSPTGSLTPAEKVVIRDWIAAGAPHSDSGLPHSGGSFVVAGTLSALVLIAFAVLRNRSRRLAKCQETIRNGQ